MYFSKAVLIALFSLNAVVIAQDCSKISNKEQKDGCYARKGDCSKLSNRDERDQCYLRKGDCENISRKEEDLYKRCKSNKGKGNKDSSGQSRPPIPPPQSPPPRPPQSWNDRIASCKRIGSTDRDANRLTCFSGVCYSINDANTRDQCWDSVKGQCDRRSTPEKRDACRMVNRECQTIEAQWRKDDCYKKHPNAAGKPPSQPPPPPPRTSSPPQNNWGPPPPRASQTSWTPRPSQTSWSPRPSQTSWGPPPQQSNPGRGPPRPEWGAPQQPSGSCKDDQECFDRGQCELIRDNRKFDECVYVKRNRHCDSMRELVSKDFCYQCTRQCEKISDSDNDSRQYKDACYRGQIHPAC